MNQGKEHGYCGYCRETLYEYLDVFLQHLNYCELALVFKSKKKDDNGGKLEKG